jgi:hypothetical protein
MRALLLLPLLLTLAACGGPDLGPPDGWEASADGTRWWRTGIDTTGLFPDHSTFEAMGVERRPEGPRHRNVQLALITTYRSNPRLADSVFTVNVAPYLSGSGNQIPLEEAVQESAKRLREMYMGPRQDPDVKFGREVPYVYPDSLRDVQGRVVVQSFIAAEDNDGRPIALKLAEPVHPVLDALTMQAATRMRYFRGGALGEYRPGFAYFNAPYPSGYTPPPAPTTADSLAVE